MAARCGRTAGQACLRSRRGRKAVTGTHPPCLCARIAEALQHTHTILASEDWVVLLRARAIPLERQSEVAGTLLEEGISALERAIAELNEAEAQIIRQASSWMVTGTPGLY